MSLVGAKDTTPELVIRKQLFARGYRYRLHVRNLPGTPDIVFPGRRKVIFVHGCFWHRHSGCRHATTPASRRDYWLPKFARTVERDAEAIERLTQLEWDSIVVWECETRKLERTMKEIVRFLENKVVA
tara:strand:- start:4721 stop:5104 length:384 start_codon:yes stop_codon:yes gene_type:complete